MSDAQIALAAAESSAASASSASTSAAGLAEAVADAVAAKNLAQTAKADAETARDTAEEFALGFGPGTATALAPGATPTLDITGPPGAKVLDLGIPAGLADDASMEAVRANPASAFAQGLSATFVPLDIVEVQTANDNAVIAGGLGNTIASMVERGGDSKSSHAEGLNNRALDWYAHAEGAGCIVDGKIAHAEGNACICSANDSHAEGNRTVAGRRYYPNVTTGSEDAGDGLGVLQYVLIPAVEGDVTSLFPNPLTEDVTTRYGTGAQKDVKGNIYASVHTPAVWTGDTPTTPNDLQWAMHSVGIVRGGDAEGALAFINIKKATWAGGVGTKVYYAGAKPYTTLIGIYSSYAPLLPASTPAGNGQHAEGLFTSSWGYGAHSEGEDSRAWGRGTHAEGRLTQATQTYAHAEGYLTKATASASHAEGESTTASAARAHAEGYLTTASGNAAHAEGEQSTASGSRSHAEGYLNTASGLAAHAEGSETTASGIASRAAGQQSTAGRDYQDAYSSGKRSANGDNQISRIQYSKSCVGAGWHDVRVLASLVDGRSYHFETMVLARQTDATAEGAVGNTFAYKFTGVVSVAAGAMTVLGTIERTLRGRTATMSGDGLSTGPRMSAYTSLYTSSGRSDLVLRFDGVASTTFYITTYSIVQELG